MAAFTIARAFPSEQRTTVVRLYWQAFMGKLLPVLRPERKALEFIELVVDSKHAISAIGSDGSVIGVVGFKTETGAFVGGGSRHLSAVYGAIGGAWRAVVLSLLERPVEPGVLLMDGLFVSERARGFGVGSALLEAVKSEAIERGCATVRLDVIDTNPRARALYERHDFIPTKTSSIGPLRHIFGFRTATTMVCKVGSNPTHSRQQ